MTKPIDPKYSITTRSTLHSDHEPVIVKTATGEPIPFDEPLIFVSRPRPARP
jgi:hypothetical protein